MTRVIVDTRSARGCWVAAHAAGLCDLDVIALVARESPSKKLLNKMRKRLRETSKVSRVSIVEIPCHTVDATGVVGDLARRGDVIVTDSAPFAYEFLLREGEATDNFGERYTEENIHVLLRRFYACQELKQRGVNPYERRTYKKVDCKRLLKTLKELEELTSGIVPKDVPLKFHYKPPSPKAVKPLPYSELEELQGTKVFVDGDACPWLPSVLEICGNTHTPVVFVSNLEVPDLIQMARKNDAGFLARTKTLPDLAIERVPIEKDAADTFIEEHIALGDIVLTDDYGLTANCLNKGALAIDYRGRTLEPMPECSLVESKDVSRIKGGAGTGRKNRACSKAFRKSLLRAVG